MQPEAARLEELRQHALEERIEVALELGYGAELIGELQALVVERPLRERPRALLMRALYRGGRQAEALEVFREGTRLLQRELGLEPGPELKELERAILRQDPSLSAAAPSPDRLRSIVVVPESGAASELVLPLAEALAGRPRGVSSVLARVVAAAELRRRHSAARRGSPRARRTRHDGARGRVLVDRSQPRTSCGSEASRRPTCCCSRRRAIRSTAPMPTSSSWRRATSRRSSTGAGAIGTARSSSHSARSSTTGPRSSSVPGSPRATGGRSA